MKNSSIWITRSSILSQSTILGKAFYGRGSFVLLTLKFPQSCTNLGIEREEDAKGNWGHSGCGGSDDKASVQTHATSSQGLVSRILSI